MEARFIGFEGNDVSIMMSRIKWLKTIAKIGFVLVWDWLYYFFDGFWYGAMATSPMWLYLYCTMFNRVCIQ